MRCDCCNKALSDYESTLRHAVSRDFLNTCVKCLEFTGIPSVGRRDLSKKLEEELDKHPLFEYDELMDTPYEDRD